MVFSNVMYLELHGRPEQDAGHVVFRHSEEVVRKAGRSAQNFHRGGNFGGYGLRRHS